MHKPEAIRENGMHNIFWDFKIQMDRWYATRVQTNLWLKKITYNQGKFAIPSDNRILKKSKMWEKDLDIDTELKEKKLDCDT